MPGAFSGLARLYRAFLQAKTAGWSVIESVLLGELGWYVDFGDGIQSRFTGQFDLMVFHAAIKDAASFGCLKGGQ